MSTKLQLNQIKSRLLFLSPTVKSGIERECNRNDFETFDNKPLGKGGFGEVWKVRNKITNKLFAIKLISKSKVIKDNMVDQINREIEIMYKIDHPYIIKLYNHYEDDDYLYLIMELASKGQLYSLLKRAKKLDEKTVVQFMKEIISSVQYLHSFDPPIIHRDIKLENILLDHDNKAKLGDFGWSNFLETEKTRDTYAGTPEYLAPEMVMKTGHDTGVDIWALGVLIFEMLTGRTPFLGSDVNTLYSDIKNVKIKWTDDFNILAKDLVGKILRFKSQDRLTLDQILSHPWFKDTPLLRQILPFTNPKNQIKSKYYLMTKTNDIKTNMTLSSSTVNVNKNSQVDSNYENENKRISKLKSKRETIREIYDIEKVETEENIRTNLDIDKLKQEIKIKNEEIALLKIEFQKIQQRFSEDNSLSKLKIEEDENLKKLREQEKEAFIKEIDNKTKKLYDTESKLSIVSNENSQLKREINELKSQLAQCQLKKVSQEEEISEMKERIKKIEKDRENEIMDYESKIREMEFKYVNNSSTTTTNINKVIEIANGYIKQISIQIKDKIEKYELVEMERERKEVEFRNGLNEEIEFKLHNIEKGFKEVYSKAIQDELSIINSKTNEINELPYNLEWYQNNLQELYLLKQALSKANEKEKENENLILILKEANETTEYKFNNLSKLNDSLKELLDRTISIKNKLKNAFEESEILFEKYGNGKKLRELLNLKVDFFD